MWCVNNACIEVQCHKYWYSKVRSWAVPRQMRQKLAKNKIKQCYKLKSFLETQYIQVLHEKNQADVGIISAQIMVIYNIII